MTSKRKLVLITIYIEGYINYGKHSKPLAGCQYDGYSSYPSPKHCAHQGKDSFAGAVEVCKYLSCQNAIECYTQHPP